MNCHETKMDNVKCLPFKRNMFCDINQLEFHIGREWSEINLMNHITHEKGGKDRTVE